MHKTRISPKIPPNVGKKKEGKDKTKSKTKQFQSKDWCRGT